MTKNDDFWGILQKFHRNRDAIRLGISPGKFLMRRAPQAGQRVWVRHPIPLQWSDKVHAAVVRTNNFWSTWYCGVFSIMGWMVCSMW